MTTLGGEVLEMRLRRIEDRLAIYELVAKYGFVVDEQDLAQLGDLWSPSGVFRTASGQVKGRNRDEIIRYYRERFQTLRPSNHFTHGITLEFDESAPDSASGVVSSHAELWRNGRAMVTALRYLDRYVRSSEGRWRFAERVQTFMYFLDVADYGAALGDPLPVRAGAQPLRRDWPCPES